MRIIRYHDSTGAIHYGQQHADGTAEACHGCPFTGLIPAGVPAQVERLLSPIAPTFIIAIGLNYRQHAEETGAKLPQFPIMFVKAPNALNHPGAPIRIPPITTQVDYECELAVVLKHDCRNVAAETALSHVLGYTCGNDVSARDWQKQWGGGQWMRGKSFDGFCPLGPVLVTPDSLPNPNDLHISTIVNGETLQDSTTKDMIFDVATLIAFASQHTTLPAGTVIMTGTPSGVGMARTPPRWLQPGDTVTVRIAGIGDLTNPVIAA